MVRATATQRTPMATPWKVGETIPFSRMSIVTATYWLTVFHLASREAGTMTPWPADTARSPVTASSRPMITTTAQAAILSMVSSDTRAAATSSLSAIGSSSVPSVVTWLRRRASTPSSQSVSAAAVKMAAAMSAWTRELEMRKRISSGTATIRVRVSPIGKFTLRSRSPGRWAGSLSAPGDDLVNVGAVDGYHRGRVQGQAGGDVGRAAPRGQVPGPRRVPGEPSHVLAVRPRQRRRFLGGRRRLRPGLRGQQAVGQQAGAHVVLQGAGAPLPRAEQEHVAAPAERPRRGGAEVHEGGHPDGGGAPRGQEGARAVAGRHDHGAAADARAGELERRVAEVEALERLAAPLARHQRLGQAGQPRAGLLGGGHRHDGRAAVGERGDDAGGGAQDVDDEDGGGRDGRPVEAVRGDGDVHTHAQPRRSRSERILRRSALRLMNPSASRCR